MEAFGRQTGMKSTGIACAGSPPRDRGAVRFNTCWAP